MLNMIKNSRLFILVMLIMTALFAAAYTAYAEDSWECTTLPEGSSQVTAYDDSIRMYFKTEGNEGKANAEKAFDFSANEQICISFNMTFTGTDTGIVRRLNLQNSSLVTTELINITGNDLKVFGTAVGTLEEHRDYQFDIGVIPTTGYAVVWMDGEQIYLGELGSKWKKFNYSSLKVLFRNTSASKNSTLESEWNITDFVVGDASAEFKTSPTDGETLVDSNMESISVTFTDQNSPEVFKKDNFDLSANGESITCSSVREGKTAIVSPENGFESGTEYTLTIKAVKDIFGTVIDENKTISFTTADSSYVPASVSISSDKNSFYDNDSAYITVNATSSSGILSTKIYVNGEVYQSYDGEPRSFVFNAESGRYRIYAEVIDNIGGRAVSETLTIDILHNELPEISVDGIQEFMEYEPSNLKNIRVRASDTDGTITKTEVYINDELYDSFEKQEKILDLSSLEAGIYTIRIVTEDNLGGLVEKKITITVLMESVSTNHFQSDFNNYVSDGNVSPGVPFFLNGDAKVLSSDDYGEEHGTVVLLKTEGELIDDVSAQGSWSRFGTPSTGDGADITMDLNLVNDKGQFYFMLKHPTQSVLCIDVMIADGVLTLSNGGSAAVKRNLTPGEWYTINYKVDLKDHKYWFTLNGELLADGFYLGNRNIEQIDIRFIMEFVNKIPVPCGIALDNLTVDYVSSRPQITSIGYDNTAKCEKVLPSAENLLINVNAELLESTMKKDTVLLYCGDEAVNYDSISYDKKSRIITLKLSEKLRSDHDYRVVISDKVTTSGGGIISGGLTAEFKTDYNDMDISQIELIKENGKIHANGKIFNRTGKSDECYIITNIFSGKRLVDTNVERTAISSGKETVFNTSGVNMGSGTHAEIYVWSSLTHPSSISSRIYSFD